MADEKNDIAIEDFRSRFMSASSTSRKILVDFKNN